MSDNCFCIVPVEITEARLTSSNIAEPHGTFDPPAWVTGTNYALGARVTRIATGVKTVFENIQALSPSTTPPESQLTHWEKVSTTNRRMMFDSSNTTQSQNTDSIVVTVTLGVLANMVMFDNVVGTSVRVQQGSYDRTVTLQSRDADDWFEYFFSPFRQRKTAIFTDLPMTAGAMTITITGAAGTTVKCGTMVAGFAFGVGKTEYGASFGIIDYSTKDTDRFGNTSVVKRNFSKRMNLPVQVENSRLEEIRDFLAENRATPLAWIAAGEDIPALAAFGYYRSFDIVIPYFSHSRCNVEIEGLT